MCLSIPSQIISIDENNYAIVDTLGVRRGVSLDLVADSVEVGDYVLIHVGFAMQKINTEQAKESLKIYKQIVDEIGEEEVFTHFVKE